MKQAFKEKRFSEESLGLVAECDDLIERYSEQGYTLTVRQLYYQMVAGDIFPDSWIDEAYNARNDLPWDTKNTEKSYKKFAKLVSDARLCGYLDWDAIVDRARSTEKNQHWDDHDQILEAAINSWAIDKWYNQERYVEVMCEKDAVAGILMPECAKTERYSARCRG